MSSNGCQPSVSDTWARTKQLSSCWREKTHRCGGRGRSEASVTEHKDILIRLNAGFIKTLFKGDGCYDTVRSRGGGGAAGLAPPVSRRHLYVFCIRAATSSSYCVHARKSCFVLFSVNNLSTSAKSSLLRCFCTSPPGGHLPITEHREVCDTLLMKFEFPVCTQRLLLIISCLFQTNRVEENTSI